MMLKYLAPPAITSSAISRRSSGSRTTSMPQARAPLPVGAVSASRNSLSITSSGTGRSV
jgi:hypothetical protein